MVSGALEAVPQELLVRIPRHGLKEPALASPLGNTYLHTGSALGRQPFREEPRLGWQVRNQHSAGHTPRRVGPVVGRYHLVHQLGRFQVLNALHHETLATHNPSVPDIEHLDGSLEVITGNAEDVNLLVCRTDHLLTLKDPPDARQTVPLACCGLEVQGLGGCLHLFSEAGHNPVGVALEEPDQLTHDLAVGGAVYLADTRP